jgi:PKD repeat protein
MNNSKRTSGLKYLVLFLSILINLSFSNLSNAQFVPELLYPHSNEVTKESVITFKWNKEVYQSLNYQMQLSLDESFFTLLADQTTPNNFFQISGLTNYGQVHYWKVRSIDGANYSDWSAVDSFYLFSPSSINGLTVWLDPNSNAVLTGSNVQTLNDNTTNANNASQLNLSQRPSFISIDSSINNKSTIRFDGIDDFLEIPDNPTVDFVNQFSIHVIVKPTTIATNKAIIVKWDYNTQGSWGFQSDFNTVDELMYAPASVLNDAGASKVITTNADMIINKPAILNLVFNGTLTSKVKYFKNFNSLLTSTVAPIPSVIPNSSATLKIAKWGGILTRYYQGDIGEILIYNNELSPSNKNLVDSYLRYKYAPPVDLGSDTIIAANALCGSINIRTKSRYQTYLWSTGSTVSSLTVTAPGTYWVTVTDFLGNVSSDTIKVYPPYSMNVPTNNQLCENSSQTWAPAYPSSSFTYLWQNGSTANSFTYSQPGSYFVKITDGSGCFINSDTLVVTIDNYPSTANLGPDTNLCSGNLIALQNGAGETVSYLWPNGATGNQYAVDTTGNYYVESININGCVARDTVHINVIGIAPLAAFATANVCDGNNAVFTDNSVPVGAAPIDGWAWDFGDTTSATTQSPSHTYALPGTYIVELFVSQGGCGAFHYDTLTVYQNPQALFTFSGHCQGQPVQFNNVSAQGNAPLTTYAWDFDMPWTGAYNTSTIPIPYREFDSTGVFDVQFTVTDANGCNSEVTIPVVIDPSPEVTFSMPDGCVNEPIAAQFTGVTQNPSTYLWDFGDNAFSILNTTSHNYSVYGDYTVSLSVTNAFNCTVVGQDQIDVFAVPVPSFDLGPYCTGTYVEMTNTSTIAQGTVAQSTWIINATDTVIGNPGFYLIPDLGQQQIQVITTSDEGCSASTFQFIEVEDSLNVSFTVGTGIAAVGEPFPFTNTTTGTNLALWNFGDQSFSSDFSPVHTYSDTYTDSTVQVYLIGLNASGCVDTAFQNVTVRPAELDLALETLFLQENGTFDFLGVKMKNEGTVSVKKVEFEVFSDKGSLFQETWNGNLLPTNDTIYVFLSQPSLQYSTEDEKEAYVCVNSIAYDWQNEAETLLDNNDRCLNLEGDGVILTTIAPNPASNEVGFQLLVTKTSTISAELIDMNGKLAKILIPTTPVEPGIVDLKADIRTLENGVYFLQFTSNGSTTTQRLVVLQ